GLVDQFAAWAALRSMICDLEFLAALYGGFDGSKDATRMNRYRFVRFIDEIVVPATGTTSYRTYGGHLYDMFRVGMVHLRLPKKLENPKNSTPVLTWSFLKDKEAHVVDDEGRSVIATHLKTYRLNAKVTVLPVS